MYAAPALTHLQNALYSDLEVKTYTMYHAQKHLQ